MLLDTQSQLQIFLGTALKNITDQACRQICKGMYCVRAGINPYLFLQRCSNTVAQPRGCCAWGSLRGCLGSGSCHELPCPGRVICMGSSCCCKRLQRGNGGWSCECPSCHWPDFLLSAANFMKCSLV